MLPDAQAVIDLLPELVLLVAADGTVLAANRAGARTLGSSVDALVGRPLFELLETPADRAAVALRRWAGSRQPRPGALVLRRADGGHIACRCDGAIMGDPGEGPPGTILLRCRPQREAASRFTLLSQKIADLTREIAARQAAEAARRESEEQFRTLADSIPTLAWMANPDGWIFWYNRRWYEYTGTTAEQMEGWGWRSVHDPDRLPDVLERWRASLATGAPFEMVFPLRGADGVFRPFLTRVLPLYDAEGRIARWFGTNTDIAAQRQAEEGLRRLTETLEQRVAERTRQLLETNARLIAESAERRKAEQALYQAQKMEVVGQLSGGFAHDFNNLLTVIEGALQVLEQEIGGGRLGRLVHSAQRAAGRGAKLTQQLLAFSRKQLLQPQRTDVNRLIIEMGDLLRGTLGSKVEIREILGPEAWPALCDVNQLETVLLNLAVNARDAMPEGGTLTIETANVDLDADYAARQDEPVRPGEYVMIAVTDSGTGIPADIVDRVFEPFFTTKERGKGTGLGLSQVYGFVKQSGGHVRICSEIGVGTTVKLYLPRSPGLQPAEAATEIDKEREAAVGTVLVVEDDPDVREFAVEVLQGLGYRIFEAADGPTALRILSREPEVDLLFTDVVMPGPNGFEVAREARALRPALKVLFTSGYTANALPSERPFEGRLIHKPYKPIDLAREVREMLGRPLSDGAAAHGAYSAD
jgi:PAS domain S-box-containing protein